MVTFSLLETMDQPWAIIAVFVDVWDDFNARAVSFTDPEIIWDKINFFRACFNSLGNPSPKQQ